MTVSLHQLAEAGGQVHALDAVLVDVQLGEDQTVHAAAQALASGPIEGLRVGQQVEGQQEELPAGVELAAGLGQLPLDVLAVGLQRRQLGLDLGVRPGGVTEEVEVLVLAPIELPELVAQPGADGAEFGQLGVQQVIELGADGRLKVRAEPDGRVVDFERLRDGVDG